MYTLIPSVFVHEIIYVFRVQYLYTNNNLNSYAII